MKFLIGAIGVIAVVFFLLGLKSQKGKAPGLIDGKLAEPDGKPNTVCSEEGTQPERAIAPLSGSANDMKAAIKTTGGVITSESDSYISATYMSSVFKFVDDLELRNAKGKTWHVRSGSRVGYSDRGVNRKRVERLRAELENELEK